MARIIPTYVGSTSCYFFYGAVRSNHSHVCGINLRATYALAPEHESFPRMWDQLLTIYNRLDKARIIPTYVGSTFPGNSLQAVRANHSHVCGINYVHIESWGRYYESFPRMWDQRNTGSPGTGEFTNHSHVCGINMFCRETQSACPESFPRMWDQHDFFTFETFRLRIIPTYVGSTLHLRKRSQQITNHSHVCGINKELRTYLTK